VSSEVVLRGATSGEARASSVEATVVSSDAGLLEKLHAREIRPLEEAPAAAREGALLTRRLVRLISERMIHYSSRRTEEDTWRRF
jgi:hypothetical protein